MCLSQLDRDTLLAVDVATRVEHHIRERWAVEGESLSDQIRALRGKAVSPDLINMLHYLRKQRNRVVHHPRCELDDRGKFERYAKAFLPELEKAETPADWIGDEIASLLKQELASLKQDYSIDQELKDAFAALRSSFMR